MRDESQRQSAHNADHPGRKIRAENIDSWRVVAEDPHCEKCNEKQHKAGDDDSQNCLSRFHLCNDLTGNGRTGRADGRAKSPVLSASALAVV